MVASQPPSMADLPPGLWMNGADSTKPLSDRRTRKSRHPMSGCSASKCSSRSSMDVRMPSASARRRKLHPGASWLGLARCRGFGARQVSAELVPEDRLRQLLRRPPKEGTSVRTVCEAITGQFVKQVVAPHSEAANRPCDPVLRRRGGGLGGA